jgi:hypothetical protein
MVPKPFAERQWCPNVVLHKCLGESQPPVATSEAAWQPHVLPRGGEVGGEELAGAVGLGFKKSQMPVPF